MTNLLCTLLSPLLLLASIPLVGFALLTTSFAFSTLFFRVLIVYAELGVALVHDQFIGQAMSELTKSPLKATSPAPDEKEHRRKSRRSSAGSGNSGSLTPKVLDSNGLGIYNGGGIERDFEGVGGWRFPGPDHEEDLWTSMNSRLELPATVGERKRHHHRSLTSSSLSSAPLISRSPVRSRTRTPNSIHVPGNASPEEYFIDPQPSKPPTALDTANVGKVLLRSKASSVSTFSLDGSSRSTQSRTYHN